jgi:iron transport multicopper oxidase
LFHVQDAACSTGIRAPPTDGTPEGLVNNPNGKYWDYFVTPHELSYLFVVDVNLTLAILRYAGAPNAEPDGSTNSTATNLLVEQDLRVGRPPSPLIHQLIPTQPLVNPGSPGGDVPADVTLDINITQVRSPSYLTSARARYEPRPQPNPPIYEMNGVSWEPPAVPALLKILSGATSPNDFLPHEKMELLPQNAIVELNIIGNPDDPARFVPLYCAGLHS